MLISCLYSTSWHRLLERWRQRQTNVNKIWWGMSSAKNWRILATCQNQPASHRRLVCERALLMRSIDVCVLLMSACSIDVCVFWYLLPCWMSAWYWCLRVGVLSLCQEGFCLFSNWGNSSALLAKMFKAVPEFLTCPYKCISFWRTACYTCAVLIYTGGVTTPKCSVYCVIRFRVRGC